MSVPAAISAARCARFLKSRTSSYSRSFSSSAYTSARPPIASVTLSMSSAPSSLSSSATITWSSSARKNFIFAS